MRELGRMMVFAGAALAAIGVLILMFGPDEPERGSSSEPPKHRPPEA